MATPRGDDAEDLGVSARLDFMRLLLQKMTSGFPAEIRPVPAAEGCTRTKDLITSLPRKPAGAGANPADFGLLIVAKVT